MCGGVDALVLFLCVCVCTCVCFAQAPLWAWPPIPHAPAYAPRLPPTKKARLGVIEAGAAADLVLYSSDPSDPATGAGVLAHPERHLRLVVKGGLVAAAPGGEGGGGEGGATLAGVNARL